MATVRVKGVDQLVSNFNQLGKQTSKGVAKALYVSAHAVRGEAIQDIATVSQGGVVTRYKKGRKPYKHIVSKEGDAPNQDTGDLMSRVNIDIQQNRRALVGTDLEYGKHLEFGTSKMGARAWLNPAFEKKRNFIIAQFKKAFRRS